ncbi:PQQ-binding-like beta-propeller repeat protein [Streptomyces sp. NPDC048258]|uniref:outer membrane protein assembly factor BamB family protein n=1 Tax=Streptomyces sp. NPDC048258 TaxID=3365527 RepID=UPI003720AB4C
MIVTIAWERALHQRGALSAYAVGEDCVVLHERRTRLVCVERADGTVRWDIPLGTWPRGIALSGDRVLVLPQEPDLLSCVDLRTGELLWSARTPRFTGGVVATEDTVVVGGWRGYTPMTGLDLADGRVRWTTTSPVHSVQPLAWGGGVLTGSGAEVVLVDAHDGSGLARWRLPEPLFQRDGAVFTPLGTDRFVAGCGQASLVALGLGSDEPDWRGAYEPFARFESVGGAVWMHRPRTGFLTVDPADGTRLWSTGTGVGQQRVAGAVPHADGFLVGADNGGIYRLGSDGQAVSRCSLGRRIDEMIDAGDGGLFVMAKGTFASVAVTARGNATVPPPAASATSGRLTDITTDRARP